MAIRVVLADDDAEVRSASAELLRLDGRFEIVAAVATAADAVAAVLEHAPDVAVLDLRMPGGGVEAARQIAASQSATVVAVMSVTLPHGVLAELLRVGVRGAVRKGQDPGLLPEVLARVTAGQVVLLVPSASAALAGVIASPGSPPPRDR